MREVTLSVITPAATPAVPAGFYEPVKVEKVKPADVCTNDGCDMPQATGNALKLCDAYWESLGIGSGANSESMLSSLVRRFFMQMNIGCGSPA